jgi:hypothetical protein
MHFRTFSGVAGVAAATVVFTLSGAGTALAKTHKPLLARGAPASLGPAATNPTSPFLAGYTTALGDAPQSNTSVTFKVPVFSCAANDSSPSVGLLNGTVDQNGDQAAAGGVLFNCTSDSYSLVAQGLNGEDAASSAAVAPRDVVTITVLTDSATGSVAMVDDQTSGALLYATDPNATAPAEQQVEGFADEGEGAIPKFGTITFSNAFADDETLGANNPAASDLESGSDLQAHTSALTNGTKFSVTFKHRT